MSAGVVRVVRRPSVAAEPTTTLDDDRVVSGDIPVSDGMVEISKVEANEWTEESAEKEESAESSNVNVDSDQSSVRLEPY